MTSALLPIVIIFSQLQVTQKNKHIIEWFSVVLSAIIWLSYYPQVTAYLGVLLSALFALKLWCKKGPSFLTVQDLPILALTAVTPLMWLAPFVFFILVSRDEESSTLQKILTVTLLFLGSLLISDQLAVSTLSIVIVIMSIVQVIQCLRHGQHFRLLLWAALLYRFSIFTPEILKLSILMLLSVIVLVKVVRVWCEEQGNKIKGLMAEVSLLIIAISGVMLGEFGYWGMLISTLCLLNIITLSLEEQSQHQLFSLPQQSMLALIFIPTTPIMVFLANNESLKTTAIGSSCAVLYAWVILRALKKNEVQSNEMSFDKQRLGYLLFFVTVMIIGSIFLLKGIMTSLFIYLGLAIVSILLVFIMSFDEKILGAPWRHGAQLFFKKFDVKKESFYSQKNYSINFWSWSVDLGKMMSWIALETEGFIRRTLAVWIIVAVVLAINLGGAGV